MPRRWSELSRVERVGLYTRQTLYFLLWAFSVPLLVGIASEHTEHAVELLTGGIIVTALSHAVVINLLRRHPDVHPLPWRRLGPLLVASAVYTALALTWGEESRTAALMVVAVSLTLPLGLLPDARIVPVLIVGFGLLFGLAGDWPLSAGFGLFVATTFVFSGRASMWVLGIVNELDQASHAKAQLAVMEERLRFSRDVHDVLGRRLSTIAVQAELAATLSARGDERAAEQMLEVRAVAHEALREARELARGYRSTDFDNELEGARSLLRSAGIEVALSVDAMPRAWHEAAGWVVRETVTNVLRHSNAGHVEISYTGEQLRVANDGVRPGTGGDGSGLNGLRERLTPLGASLIARADGGDRWLVVAELPGTGPLSAAR